MISSSHGKHVVLPYRGEQCSDGKQANTEEPSRQQTQCRGRIE